MIADRLAPVEAEAVRRKGSGQVSELYAGVQLASPALAGSSILPGVRLGARVSLGARLGLRLGADWVPAPGATQGVSWSLHRFGASAALTWAVPLGPLRAELGPELGYGLSVQSLPNARTFVSSEGTGGATLALCLPVGPLLSGCAGIGRSAALLAERRGRVGSEARRRIGGGP